MSRKVVTLKLSSLGYQIRQGFRNIFRNKMFSLASVATMTVCIFVFGAFFSIIMNVNAVRVDLEEKVGVTVFFEQGIEESAIEEIGEKIKALDHVTEVTYTSAEEAWENYKKEYLAGNESLAEGFKDNPLANSASYTVLVDRIENQDTVVEHISALDGVRKVNQSSGAAQNLRSFNNLFTYASIAIIAVLLVVVVILISNTISVGISVRKDEIAIMKLIGATDAFVRAPFIVEGIILGVIGSMIPMLILYITYSAVISALLTKFGFFSSINGVLLDVGSVFSFLLPSALLIGIGLGMVCAVIMLKRHLDV